MPGHLTTPFEGSPEGFWLRPTVPPCVLEEGPDQEDPLGHGLWVLMREREVCGLREESLAGDIEHRSSEFCPVGTWSVGAWSVGVWLA